MDVLGKESALYGDILKLSKSKTDVIVKGRIAELENITRLEQDMILRISKLEDAREKLTEKLSKQLGADSSFVNVTSLRKLLPEEQAGRLGKSNTVLSGILKELDDTNTLNSKLISNSLEYINFSINLLAGAAAESNLYGNSGQVNGPGKRNFFDMRL